MSNAVREMIDKLEAENNCLKTDTMNRGFMFTGSYRPSYHPNHVLFNTGFVDRRTKIEEILTVREYRNLLDTNYLAPKKNIRAFLATIKKLINNGCFDDEFVNNNPIQVNREPKTVLFMMNSNMSYGDISDELTNIDTDTDIIEIHTGDASAKLINFMGKIMSETHTNFELTSNWYDQEVMIYERYD